MGVVLPHGGLVAVDFHDPEVKWRQRSRLRLGSSVGLLPAEFAPKGSALGTLSWKGVDGHLAFLNDVTNDNRIFWHMCVDAGLESIIPRYFLAKETFEALRRAENIDDDDGKVDIDGRHYRLHAAYMPVWDVLGMVQLHVALLIPVDA
jgi:hypothetical protein